MEMGECVTSHNRKLHSIGVSSGIWTWGQGPDYSIGLQPQECHASPSGEVNGNGQSDYMRPLGMLRMGSIIPILAQVPGNDKDLPLLPSEIEELVSIWKLKFEHEATWNQLSATYPESPLPLRYSAPESHGPRERESSEKHRRREYAYIDIADEHTTYVEFAGRIAGFQWDLSKERKDNEALRGQVPELLAEKDALKAQVSDKEYIYTFCCFALTLELNATDLRQTTELHAFSKVLHIRAHKNNPPPHCLRKDTKVDQKVSLLSVGAPGRNPSNAGMSAAARGGVLVGQKRLVCMEGTVQGSLELHSV
ncbi:hypothetical protein B0H14DRAFT_2643180 [Mycena olivaceomarginata]|nr:hypothetical protein B0H14DRAFT_2643180 [Mycena olivaceomarginata]